MTTSIRFDGDFVAHARVAIPVDAWHLSLSTHVSPPKSMDFHSASLAQHVPTISSTSHVRMSTEADYAEQAKVDDFQE